MDRRQFAKLSSAAAAGLAVSPWVKATEAPLLPRPEAPLLPRPEAPLLPRPEAPLLPRPEAPLPLRPEAPLPPQPQAPLQPRYIVASSLYGYAKISEILPEVRKTGATAIDIWPLVHGNQREQLNELGEERFAALLKQHQVSLGCITQYKLGPFGLQAEMRLAGRLGCHTIVTGGSGPAGLKAAELKAAVRQFVEKMKPHLAVAAEADVIIAIENHANNLIESADSLKWLAELRPNKHLAVALAPYHLPQNARAIAELIASLDDSIAMFYAWQHGKGSSQNLTKQQELLQMPGRGALDFGPLLSALAAISYQGWTEIFMHPFPRGIPILATTAAVTEEINRARAYLSQRL